MPHEPDHPTRTDVTPEQVFKALAAQFGHLPPRYLPYVALIERLGRIFFLLFAVRNLLVGACFFLVGLAISGSMIWIALDELAKAQQPDTDMAVGWAIALIIGIGTVWMGTSFFRDGLRGLPQRSQITAHAPKAAKGTLQHAATKPHLAPSRQKNTGEQFREL